MSALFLIGQIILGVYFIYAGVSHFTKAKMMNQFAQSKNLPAPEFMVALSGAVLIAGGVSIFFPGSVFFVIGSLALVVFLLLASFTFHAFWNIKDNPQERMTQMHYFMGNVSLAAAMLMLVALIGSLSFLY